MITEPPQDWGNRLLEGTNKSLCATGARRKEQYSHKTQSQICPECPGISGQQFRCGPTVGLRPNKEGTQPQPSTENCIQDLLSRIPPIRRKPSFHHNQSLTSGSFHKPLIFIHQRINRMKTTITEN